MTGTERSALRLALGVLRRSCLVSPQPNRGDPESGVDEDVFSDVIDTLSMSGMTAYLVGFHVAAALPRVHRRVLRARVCLLLRAVLRAEAGDRGLWWIGQRKAWPYFFPVEWRSERVPPAATRKTAHGWEAQPGDAYRLAVPLWSQAPGRTR